LRAHRVGADSTLSQIIKLVSDAQTSKAPIQDLADVVAGYFVPTIIILGILTFFSWLIIISVSQSVPHGFPSESNFVFVALSFAIAVVVVACPCALGLATPTAVMVGTGVGASLGILIKGGEPLETAHKVTALVFDKTGTLTTGQMGVVAVYFMQSHSFVTRESEFTELVATIESNSEHPIGKAIALLVDHPSHSNHKIVDFKSISGQGIQCQVVHDGSSVQAHVGNAKFMKEHRIQLTEEALNLSEVHGMKGHSIVYVGLGDQLCGMIAVADIVRPESRTTVLALQKKGIRVLMVTGDQSTTANVIGQQCGITEIHSGISPGGKLQIVEDMQKRGEIVAMVGDGINDSASLAKADIGIAMFGGTDVAMEAAHIVLMRPDLTDVVVAIDLSKTIFRRIWFNFWAASVYNVLMVPLAMGLGMPWGVRLPTMVSGLAMSLSSVSVVTASLLLRLYKRPIISENGDFTRPKLVSKESALDLGEGLKKSLSRLNLAMGKIRRQPYRKLQGEEDIEMQDQSPPFSAL
jgi:Cu+-exporting ATPase